MSELMGCQVPGFEQRKKRTMNKQEAEEAKAARHMDRPENLLGCLLATTTSDGPLTGVVSSIGESLHVARFEGGRKMMLTEGSINRGQALYAKITRGAKLGGAVDALPDEEKSMEGLAKYEIQFPAVAEIAKPLVKAAFERTYLDYAVYAEKKVGSRFFFHMDNCVAARAVTATGLLLEPVSPVVRQSDSAAMPAATATAPAMVVPELSSAQPTQPPSRVLREGKRTPTPPGTHEYSSLQVVVAGAQVRTSSSWLPPRSTPGSAVDTWSSSGKGDGAGSAALGALVEGALEKTGKDSGVGGAGGGEAPAKGQPAVGREEVGGEEEKLKRAKAAKKLRREALLRGCIASAEHLHLEFRSVESADAMDRGDDELSRLYLAEGDNIVPDNTRWGVRPRGQPLPYDCWFPDDEARGAVGQGTSEGGRNPEGNGKRGKGSSGGGESMTAEQPEFTGQWRG